VLAERQLAFFGRVEDGLRPLDLTDLRTATAAGSATATAGFSTATFGTAPFATGAGRRLRTSGRARC
jgi:hypothetical protein